MFGYWLFININPIIKDKKEIHSVKSHVYVTTRYKINASKSRKNACNTKFN